MRGVAAHVDVDELVVDCGVAVPVREVSGALERRELVAGRDVVVMVDNDDRIAVLLDVRQPFVQDAPAKQIDR